MTCQILAWPPNSLLLTCPCFTLLLLQHSLCRSRSCLLPRSLSLSLSLSSSSPACALFLLASALRHRLSLLLVSSPPSAARPTLQPSSSSSVRRWPLPRTTVSVAVQRCPLSSTAASLAVYNNLHHRSLPYTALSVNTHHCKQHQVLFFTVYYAIPKGKLILSLLSVHIYLSLEKNITK